MLDEIIIIAFFSVKLLYYTYMKHYSRLVYAQTYEEKRNVGTARVKSARTHGAVVNLCTHTQITGGSISVWRRGRSGFTRCDHPLLTVEEEKKDGTRRFAPIDDAARVHLHESLLPDCGRTPGIVALAERRTRFHVDRTSIRQGERERASIARETG